MKVIFLKTRHEWPDVGGQSIPHTEVDGPYDIPGTIEFPKDAPETEVWYKTAYLNEIWLFNIGIKSILVKTLRGFSPKDAINPTPEFINSLREWEKESPFHKYANPFTGRKRENESDVLALYVPERVDL